MSRVVRCPRAPDATSSTSGAPASARRRQAPLRTHHGRASLRNPAVSAPNSAAATALGTSWRRNRTGSENLTLAIRSPDGLPCPHGNTACMTPRGLGTDPARGASLYSGAGSAWGDLDLHRPRLTGAGWHVAGTAQSDVTAFVPPSIERPATAATSTSAAGATPSWRSTGPSWLYPHPDPCGGSR